MPAFISIIGVIALGAVLCIIEIPRIVKSNSFRELCVFSVLLLTGVATGILRSLKIEIYNISDFITWTYSPFLGIMKSLLE